MKRKISAKIYKVLILFLILAIATSLFFVYRLTNKLSQIRKEINQSQMTIGTMPSNDLKTYKNNQFGFSFQYPQNWSVDDTKINDNRTIIVTNYKLKDKEPVMVGSRFITKTTDKFDMTIYQYPIQYTDKLSLITWLKENDYYVSAMCGEPTSTHPTTIGGKEAVILNFLGCTSYTVFSWDTHVYSVSYSPGDSDHKSQYNQILSSFQFTDSQ